MASNEAGENIKNIPLPAYNFQHLIIHQGD